MTEDETVGWHHRLSEHEFEQTVGRTGKPAVLQSMGSQRVRTMCDRTERQNNVYSRVYELKFAKSYCESF